MPAPDEETSLRAEMPRRVAARRGIRAKLASGRVDAVANYGLQMLSLGLGFVSQVAVARVVGVSGYGVYAYALAWAALVVQPSLLGLDRVLIRELATYRTAGKFGLMHGLIRRADQAALIAAVLFGGVVAVIALPISHRDVRTSVAIGVLTIPVAALGRVRLATLQGLRRASLGQLTQGVGRTAYFIAFLGIAVAVSSSAHLSPEAAVGAQTLAFAGALATGSFVVRRTLPAGVMRTRPIFESRSWARSLPALAVLTGLTILNAQLGVIMLGAIGAPADAGRFNAAWSSAAIIIVGMTAVGQVLAPRVAVSFASGDRKAIEGLLTRASKASLAFAIPPTLFLLVGGPWLLGLFGHAFRSGSTALAILVGGQLFNAATGPLGVTLIMTKHERFAALAALGGTCLNVVLCVLLIPMWHGSGAAVATAASIVVINSAWLVGVALKLGIAPSLLGIRLRLKRGTG